MLTQWNKGSDLTFKVNPHWAGAKPNFTTLKIMIVPNDNSRVLLLKNKNADIIENPPGNLINELSATRICRRISSRRRASTSSSSTSTSRRSRIRRCARR